LIPFIFPYHFNEPLYNPNAKKGNKIKRQTHYHSDYNSNKNCKHANITGLLFDSIHWVDINYNLADIIVNIVNDKNTRTIVFWLPFNPAEVAELVTAFASHVWAAINFLKHHFA
jgi:hypothetical protein